MLADPDAQADPDVEVGFVRRKTAPGNDDSQHRCLYCHEDESLENPLIVPCNCKRVHRQCLDDWRCNPIKAEHFNKCEMCNVEYKFEQTHVVFDKWFVHAYVAAHVSALVATVLGVVGLLSWFLGLLLRHLDEESKDGWTALYPEYASHWWFWTLAGTVVIFAIVGFVITTAMMVAANIKGGGGCNNNGCDCSGLCNVDPGNAGTGKATAASTAKTTAATKSALLGNAVCCVLLASIGVVYGLVFVVDISRQCAQHARVWAHRKLGARQQRIVDFGDVNRATVAV